MCLGSGAKAANKAAMRQYRYNLRVRKRKHMHKLSAWGFARNQYKQNIDNINIGLARSYTAAQTKLNRLDDAAMQASQKANIQALQNSGYAKLAAMGRTGKSVERFGTVEAAALGRFYAGQSAALTDAREDFMIGVKQAREQAKTAQMQQFSKVAFMPQADVAPPRPVLKNVAQAKFMDALSIGSSLASMFTGLGGMSAKGFLGTTIGRVS